MLIAFDPSTVRFGVALGKPEDAAPKSLVWRLPGADAIVIDRMLAGVADSITSLCKVVKPTHVVIEAPIVTFDRSAHTMIALMQLTGVARAMAKRGGAEIIMVASQTVRKHFVGAGRPENPKRAVIERCRLLGWEPEDDNAADAMATWCWGMSSLFPGWAPKGTPLFASGKTGGARAGGQP